MRRLEVHLRRSPTTSMRVGTLAESDRRLFFEFDKAFLESGIQTSPFKLSARHGLIEHTDLGFGPLPGVFDDSLPDGWGLLLMDRFFRKQGVDPASLSPLDRLAYIGECAMGALTYRPPADRETPSVRALDLAKLGRSATKILAGDAADVLPELFRAGGSPAGARPKVLVGLRKDSVISGEQDLPAGFEHWIVKFRTRVDSKASAMVEHVYARLARAAGVTMQPTRVLPVGRGEHYFATRRFDRRSGNARVHMHTFANLLHANFRVPALDYADLLKVTAAMTRNRQDVLMAFRMMVFNVVMHNRDDHGKNFAFLMNERGEWSLAPAYDLTFSAGPGGEHSTTINGEGAKPTRADCMAVATGAGIESAEAKQMIDKVNQAASRWQALAKDIGLRVGVVREIKKSIGPI